MKPLPGDKYDDERCKQLAALHDCPVSNICRYCGEPIIVMAFTMTGSCCTDHEKLRYNPQAYIGPTRKISDVEKG